MTTPAIVAVLFVAVLHLGILVLEMFLWKTPYGGRRFGLSRQDVETTATMAANQGLYNGFLAAGLVWAVVAAPEQGTALATFFLVCVLIAGLFGAATAKKTILFIQALPAAVALALVLMA